MRRPKKRRGIVLLVVLSLLAIFMLMATTFVVVAGNYRSAALITSRTAIEDSNPEKIVDNVILTLIGDTDDPQSPMRGHSLLRDLYGDDGFTAHVQNITPLLGTAGQFFDVRIEDPFFSSVQASKMPRAYNGQVYQLRRTRGFYNGCLLSFTKGSARDLTTRIIDYDPTTSTFRLMPLNLEINSLPRVGDRLVVNGRPFSGFGVGYNPLTQKTDSFDPGPDGEWGQKNVNDDNVGPTDDFLEAGRFDDIPHLALQPNRWSFNDSTTAMNAYVWGGADESYDAADFQNVHLAAVTPHPANPNVTAVLPSYHRPALVNWWIFNVILPAMTQDMSGTQPTTTQLLGAFLLPFGPDHIRNTGDDPSYISVGMRDRIVELKRRIILRPLPEMNPQFTGSNAAFTSAFMGTAAANANPQASPYLAGPWDVDNDNDGDRDSIWMDVGFGIKEDKDGKLFKPLVAILCTDLDGRLNINAHGSPGHILSQTIPPSNLAGAPTPPTARGLGVGPGDVDLSLFLSNNMYGRLMFGFRPPNTGRTVVGRYGSDGVPTAQLLSVPGTFGIQGANTSDFLSWVKFYQHPVNYFNLLLPPGGYQSPPDLYGELMVGLDHRGQPEYSSQDQSRHMIADNPYEMNLFTPSHFDAPFGVAELEALLRFNDADINPPGQTRPQRLLELVHDYNTGANLFSNFQNARLNRRLVTTHSFDLPVPNIFEPSDLRGFDGSPLANIIKPNALSNNDFHFHHVSEILRARLIQRMRQVDPSIVPNWNIVGPRIEQVVNRHLLFMLSPDLHAGVRMDLNRPFGNGRDENRNDIVDEHGFHRQDATEPARNLEASLRLDTVDNNGNGFVDEIDEEEHIWTTNPLNRTLFDHDNDGQATQDADAFLARAHYARHLYILVMALKDPDWFTDKDLDGDGMIGSADPKDTAQLIAQWVVNVVDYRDPDAINTPFEFDSDPFDAQPGPDALWDTADDIPGWSVDGLIGANPGPDGRYGTLDDFNDAASPDRGLVWGVERPEMLITETFALHDRRTEDLDTDDGVGTKTDPMSNPQDQDFDQRMRPQGSFFVELYNPWASDFLRKPAEFYNGPRANNGIMLHRATPAWPGTPTRSPVWRLVVTEDKPDLDAPYNSSRFKPNANGRVIYFTDPGIAPGDDFGTAKKVHRDPTIPIAPLLGGRYAVIGTYRHRTQLPDPTQTPPQPNGIDDFVTPIGRNTSDLQDGSLMIQDTRRIVLQPHAMADQNRVYVEDNGTSPLPVPVPNHSPPQNVANVVPPIAIPINGLEITEQSYPVANTTTPDGEPAYTPVRDKPFDLGTDFLEIDGTHAPDGTTAWNRVVHLQRLANPLLPHNPYPGETSHDPKLQVNPYLTVDSSPIDLTTFNGVTNDENQAGGMMDMDNNKPFGPAFARQRGENSSQTGDRLLWEQEPLTRTSTPAPLGNVTDPTTPPRNTPLSDHYFNRELQHSLGFLNGPYGPRFQLTAPNLFNYVGAPESLTAGNPFPWLSWANRPFLSQYELMDVPTTSSFDLLDDWKVFDLTRGDSPYDARNAASPPVYPEGDFAHLLNFMSTTDPTGKLGANLGVVFDFTHVPSQFVGTETYLNPAFFAPPDPINGATDLLHPPFSYVSNFREPGKVNLNTLYSESVLDAVRGSTGLDGKGPLFRSLVDSRRGFGERPPGALAPGRRNDAPSSFIGSGTIIPTYDPNSSSFDGVVFDAPTIFANPFRAFRDGPLSPLPRWDRPFVETTMLRSNRFDPQAAGTDPWPQPTTSTIADSPLIGKQLNVSLPFKHDDPNRNPYFRYEAFHRFANSTTTRSNVYAIWITVGFFEVETVAPTALNPFGYRLGGELGWETGNIKRHRAFFVVDRSIPVAFEPGKTHNTERAILLRRFIE